MIRALQCLMTATLLGAGLAAAGCGSPPQIEDRTNLHLLAALRTACSTQNAESLENVADRIESRHAEGRLSDTERQAFRSIIETARAGRWQEAERETHRFQRAQQR